MRTVNTVTLLGNVVRSAEQRITSSGKQFSPFTIATQKDSPRYSDQPSVSEFHNIVAWGNLGSIAETFCKKGQLVYLEGYLKTRSWTHENGSKVFKTEIVATNIIAIPSPLPPLRSFQSHSVKKNRSPAPAEDFFSATPEDFYDQ